MCKLLTVLFTIVLAGSAQPLAAQAFPRIAVPRPGDGRDASVLAFSPDGSTLATATGGRGQCETHRWSLQDGRRLALLPDEATSRQLAFSPDGRHLATTGQRWYGQSNRPPIPGPPQFPTWDQEATGKHRLKANEEVPYLAHASGGTLVTSHPYVPVHRETGQERPIGKASNGSVNSLAIGIGKETTRLATAAQDGPVTVWDREKGEDKAMLQGHRSPVQTLASCLPATALVPAGTWAHAQPQELNPWDREAKAEAASSPPPLSNPTYLTKSCSRMVRSGPFPPSRIRFTAQASLPRPPNPVFLRGGSRQIPCGT